MKSKSSNKKVAGNENNMLNPAVTETVQATAETIQNIELSMIRCSAFNPRKYRTEEDLEELKASIINFGIIQPVTLRKCDDFYEIVCGERRYRASLMAGLLTIPAMVKNYTDEEAMEITILENLQRRDINPVEEAVSFGKLMEVRGYAIEDLVKQFGKTDKYIRSRLQLRSLIDKISELLAREEITLAVALEIARFCPEIQEEVYSDHLGDDSYSWKNVPAKDFRKLLENGYSTDLSKYEFDKTDCEGCRSNSSIYDLFMDGNCGCCQNLNCLRNKQAAYIASETTKLINEKKDLNVGICVSPNSFAVAEVVDNLTDTGCEIYEMKGNSLPVAPVKPVKENFESEEAYMNAERSYDISLERHNIHAEQINEMIQTGKAQLMVDVSKRKPELCYRLIPEKENKQEESGVTVEKLLMQDQRNKEIAFEKGMEDIKRTVKENIIPDSEFQPLEEKLMYYIMLSSLRKDNYQKIGFKSPYFSNEEKIEAVSSLTEEQKNIIRRDFIVRYLPENSSDRQQSNLLIEFANLHFPDVVSQIKEQYNEVYKKRHIRIEERIRELQPFTVDKEKIEDAVVLPEDQSVETVPSKEPDIKGYEETVDAEMVEDMDLDALIICSGFPEYSMIGESVNEEELLNVMYEETAA